MHCGGGRDMTPWNDERIETIKVLWAAGVSCQKIADALGGEATKNAVHNKVRRLKLPPRANPYSHRHAAPKDGSVSGLSVPLARNLHSRAKAGATGRNLRYDAPQVYRPFNGNRGAWDALEGSTPVALVDHVDGCRWPIGEDRPIHFCGLPSVNGRSYCAVHYHRSLKHL